MRDIEQAAFAAAVADGAIVLDVREPEEYAGGHVPGARLLPVSQVARRLSDLDRGRRHFVMCDSGSRSSATTEALRRAGVDAVNVLGGFGAWKSAGRPVVTGTHSR